MYLKVACLQDESSESEDDDAASDLPVRVRSPVVVEISDASTSDQEEIHSNVSHTVPVNDLDDLELEAAEMSKPIKVAEEVRQPRKRQKTARMKEYLGIETEDDEIEEKSESLPKKKTSPKLNNHIRTTNRTGIDNGKTNCQGGKGRKRSHSPDKRITKKQTMSRKGPDRNGEDAKSKDYESSDYETSEEEESSS